MMSSEPLNIESLSNKELKSLLESMTSQNILDFNEGRTEIIKLLLSEQKRREDFDKDRLDSFKNFDFSNIVFEFEGHRKDDDSGRVLAVCKKDRISLLIKNWIKPYQFFQNIVYVINHESLHAVIDRLLLEDGFSIFDDSYDAEYPMYAGAMDELLGLNGSFCTPTAYMDYEVFRNTEKMLKNYRKLIGVDYDL